MFPPSCELTHIFMVDSFPGQAYKNVQRFLHSVAKAVMCSHHFQIPLYDMLIRLRLVRLSPSPTFSATLNRFLVVVYCFHFHRHAGLGIPRFHKLFPLPAAKRQAVTFHVPRDRNRYILFHL